MNENEERILKSLLKAFKYQWDLNQPYRDGYDEDLEYYLAYRDENEYPLAYNMTFPQLLPRIMTMLSRMLEQIYQGGSSDLIGVRPRKRADVERAPRVQSLLSYQLETLNCIDMSGASYLFNLQWMLNAISFGKGIAKLYWRKEERIAPRRIYYPQPVFDKNGRLQDIKYKSVVVQEPQIVYDGPYAEVLHNKMFVPHPQYKSIQQMPFVFCVYKRSLDYVRSMQEKGIYKNISDLETPRNRTGYGVESYIKSLGIEGYNDFVFEDEIKTPDIDIIEGYGKIIFPEDETPYEIGSGVKIKGKESEALFHIGNYKSLLSITKYMYEKRPFFDIGAYFHPELFWDVGIIRLGKGIQEQYDTLANTRYQNALMGVNQMLQVRMDADIPPEALVTRPFGIVPVSEIGKDVAPLPLNDMSQTGIFREQEEFFKSCIEDISGMYRYNMGATPQRQEAVGVVYGLQQMGESRTKLLLMTMDHQGFQPFLRYMMHLNTFHLPDDFEARIQTRTGEIFTPLFPGDIHPDYDFTARYTAMEPALGKRYRAESLLQLAATWQKSPFLQHHQWMKAIMELFDFKDTDRYLKDPQQLQQEQMQNMKRQVEMELQRAMLQDQMDAQGDQRQLTRDIIKGLLK